MRLRHNYLTLPPKFFNVLFESIQNNEFLDDIVFASVSYFSSENESSKRTDKVLWCDDFFENIVSDSNSEINLNSIMPPFKFIDDPNVRNVIESNGWIYKHIAVRLYDQKLFDSDGHSDKNSILCSFNLILPNDHPSLQIIDLYLSGNANQAYAKYVMFVLANTASTDSGYVAGIDPVAELEYFILELSENLPDVGVAIWNYDERSNSLSQMMCSEDFFYDIDDASCPIYKSFLLGEGGIIPNLAKLSQESAADGATRAMVDMGWRSGLLRPFKLKGEVSGVTLFFRKRRGIFPSIYAPYVGFVVRQIERHIAENEHFLEVIKWKGVIQKLTPLLALGNESSERMHDVRDKLTAVKAKFDNLSNERRPPNSSEVVKLAREGRAIADQMSGILSQHLNTFRYARARRRNISIIELASEVREKHSPLFETKGVNLNIVCHTPDAIVRVQKFYFLRVMQNLLSNALYFSRQGGSEKEEVIMSFQVRNDAFISIVEDSGPGISDIDLANLFEPGYTTKPSGDSSSLQGDDGYGIGLSIVSSIVENHGGEVSVGSSKLGGAKFIVKLPMD